MMQKFTNKLNITPVKAFNKMKPISGVKRVSNTTSRVDNDKTSWVQSFEYDEEKQELTVTFKDGFIAHYPNITKDEAAAFAESDSKGRFVHENLYHRKYY